MVAGTSFLIDDVKPNKDILISSFIASKMKLNVGDKLFLYFIQKNGQLRPKDFLVKGIY